MSNIHGLSDAVRRPNNNVNHGNFQGQQGEIPNFLHAYYEAQMQRREPRKESFCDMLRHNMCPGLTMKYFVSIISVMEIITFLVTVVASFIEGYNLSSITFLGPNPLVYRLFDKYAYAVKHNFQLWRWVTPIFLHAGYKHITMNVISQLIFGSILEQMVGFKHMAGIYIISG